MTLLRDGKPDQVPTPPPRGESRATPRFAVVADGALAIRALGAANPLGLKHAGPNDSKKPRKVYCGEPSGSAAPATRARTTGSELTTHDLRFHCEFPGCERAFNTIRGRGVHQRSAHPDWTDSRAITTARKARWNPEEKSLLARREAQLRKEGVKFLNLELAKTFKERSTEAIKGIRRRDSYKRRVAQVLDEIEEESSSNSQAEELILHSPSDQQEDLRSTALQDDKVLGKILDHIKHLPPLTMDDYNAHTLQYICNSLEFLGPQAAKEQLSLYLFSIFTSDSRTHRPTIKNDEQSFTSNRKKRRAEYARIQNLWRKNRGKCLRSILKDAYCTKSPDKEIMVPFWETILCRDSLSSPGPKDPRNIHNDLWQPISEDEIKISLPALNTAPGPDGVSARMLRKVPLEILTRILNIILWCRDPPRHLLESKTSLIPKKNGAKEPSEFRPITVSSVITRTLHKILAARLTAEIPIDPRQKAFQSVDGCAENIFLLDLVLRKHHQEHRPLYMATLDVAKAFDTISHQAIFDVLKTKGVPDPMIQYIEQCYLNSTTTLSCVNWISESIHPKCGVKQGDPLSPTLFNLIIDELLIILPSDTGTIVGNRTINAMAFADDRVLMATTPRGLQGLLDRSTAYLAKCGLNINTSKCQTVSLKTVPHEKKTIVDKDTIFLCNGKPLPALKRTDQWRYLGIPFTPEGKATINATHQLQEMVDKLSKASLKPQQRLVGLTAIALPSLYHSLILGTTHLSILNKLDILARNACRKWLNLPHDCINAYFHADIKEGGLGIPSLRWLIPLKRKQRLQNLRHSGSLEGIHSAFLTSEIKKAELRLKDQNSLLDSDESLKKRWACLLHRAPDGAALKESRRVPQQHLWVREGTRFLTGKDFILCNKLRVNALPVKSRTTRGRNVDRYCRAGCLVPETQNHVLQICHRTHAARIRRHNAAVKYLQRSMENLGYKVEAEPHFRTSVGLRKPDLIGTRSRTAVIIDAQIVGDQCDLDEAHKRKIQYYASLADDVKRRYNVDEVKITSATINSRGIWSHASANDLTDISAIRKGDLKVISTRTLIGGVHAYRIFMASTSVHHRPRAGVG